MRILQLCFRMPYPLKDGGAIAMFNMMQGFIEADCEVTLVVPVTSKHDADTEKLPPIFSRLKNLTVCRIYSDITFTGALKNIFSNKPYYLSRYESSDFSLTLKDILTNNEFDIIQVESLKMSCYLEIIRKYSKAKVVLRSHNVEFMIWERYVDSLSFGLKKWYLQIMVRRLKKYEIDYLNRFDAIVPITEYDGNIYKNLGCHVPLIPAASGIDTAKFVADHSQTEDGSVFHLGALDWMPNLDAVEWFLKDIWPLIHKKYSSLRFYLAGRNMPGTFQNLNMENVIICGEVEDAVKFMNSKSVMVVPLRSGSGMRIKIIEGMALGKIIISTSIGAEGIDYTDRKNILIAETPEEFLSAVYVIQNNRKFAEEISIGAMKLANEKYDNNAITGDLVRKYSQFTIHNSQLFK